MHMALSSLNTSKPCMRLFLAESQHPVLRGCSHCSFTHLCKIESVVQENKTVRVKYKLQRVQLQNEFKKGRHDLLQLRMGVRHFVCRPNRQK